MRLLTSLTIALVLPATAAAQAPPRANVAEAAASITAEDYLRRISIIAHDSMGGRDTPSAGLEQTAAWIAGEFRTMGLKPGGDAGSFVQRYPIHRVRLDTARSMITVRDGPAWQFGTDLVKIAGGDTPDGVTGPTVVISGTPEGAAGALADLDLAGAIAVVLLPVNAQGAIGRPELRLLVGVARQGAAAVIGVADFGEAIWSRFTQGQRGSQQVPPWAASADPPVVLLRSAAAGPVFAQHQFDLAGAMQHLAGPIAAAPVPTLGLTVTTALEVVERFDAPNVVGVLEGRDPALRGEYVVYSAHMDHVGTGRPVDGDSIYNGADDDASGTTAIVEVAEAFSLLLPAPRRSIIFLLVSGEEKGLWGSDYFGAHPSVPIGQIVANLNADMVGRNWTDTIVAIGKEHSDLGATLNRVNAAHPALNMTAIDDLWPEENFYFRSDHYNFAKRGVPVLFFFNGVHEDYHRPSDHVEKIDEEKASRIAKLLFYLGLEVANAGERPRWNPESYEQIVTEGR